MGIFETDSEAQEKQKELEMEMKEMAELFDSGYDRDDEFGIDDYNAENDAEENFG